MRQRTMRSAPPGRWQHTSGWSWAQHHQQTDEPATIAGSGRAERRMRNNTTRVVIRNLG
jgi:hypothetical protein